MTENLARERTLYIMCGLPLGGKSTAAPSIADATKSRLVTFDNVTVYGDPFSIAGKIELWKLGQAVGVGQVEYHLSNGSSVVYDACNPLRSDRDKLREIAEKQNATSKLIYVNTPLTEIIYRLKESGSPRIKILNFGMVRSQFESPTSDEKPIELKPEDIIDVWVKQNLLES